MSSFSILPNLSVNRFQAIRGLSSTTFLPNPGDIFSSDTVRLIFVRQSNTSNKFKKVDWVGKIKITINSIESLPNSLYRVNSKISFDNEAPSEIQIPDIDSSESVSLFFEIGAGVNNIVDLQTNGIHLNYIDGILSMDIESDNYRSVNISGSLYSEDIRTIFGIDLGTQNYNYRSSSSYITFKKNIN